MKDKFEILNNVKINIDEYKEIQFDNNDALKKKMKNRIKPKNIKYIKGIAVASLALILGSGIVLQESVWADIQEIWYSLGDVWNMKKDEAKTYRYSVNKIAEDKNVKILLKDIVIDDGALIMDLNIDYRKFNPCEDFTEKQKKDWSIDKWGNGETELTVADINNIYVDGVKLIGNSWSIGDHYKDINKDKSVDVVMEQGIDGIAKEGDYEAISRDKFPYIINKDKIYKFKIQIKKLHLDEDWESKYSSYEEAVKQGGPHAGVIRGNWEFNLDIKGSDLTNTSKNYTLNETINIPLNSKEAKIEISEIRVSPISLEMDYKFSGINNAEFENIELKIVDENNKELPENGMNWHNITHEVNARYKNILNNYDELKIVPYIIDNEGKIKEIFEDRAVEIKLNK